KPTKPTNLNPKTRNPQITNPQTLVVTEEWLGYIGSDPKPNNIRFASIPNVVPPERLKAIDFPGFYEAAMTKMEAPFEQLQDRLKPPVDPILGDVELMWAIGIGNRRNIPVASVWTMPAASLDK
ncbi:isoform 2 of udp-glycosyltransferase 87a2, partial [Fagus crenata]